MPEIKIKDIKVGDRFRKKFEDIKSLADSIKEFGLIQPIIVDENNNLIAGERRLKACKQLKKKVIEVKHLNDLTPLEKREIELEENIQRRAFTWQEEVSAKHQLHILKQQVHGAAVKGHETMGGWKIKDTARALGESTGSTSMDIQLALGMKAFPELLKEKSKTIAFKKLKQKQERILQEELSKRLKEHGIIDNPSVMHGNCIEEMGKIEAASVDLIIADPPFGIELDKAESFRKSHDRVYPIEDDAYTILDMLDKAIAQMYRILKSNRHLYLFCGVQHFPKIRELLIKHGFSVHYIPLIWDKGSGSYPSQSVSFVNSYEAFLFCWKGKRLLNGAPRDVFPIKRVPAQKKIHPTEKPTELLRALIELSSLPGEKVLDPFAGSGSTLVAAKEMNRQGIGIELDATYHAKICKRLKEVKDGD